MSTYLVTYLFVARFMTLPFLVKIYPETAKRGCAVFLGYLAEVVKKPDYKACASGLYPRPKQIFVRIVVT